ncbi:YqjF family protein [Pseudonocardia sp. HH130630-07]|uniref:YqjF family protein n=1 Tax=Pseudonocardia sp. HH130630-07 TaxID=1690815 RepID=UPI000814E0F6|nr:DUF2071 domain-containing protein [Pseudonocardia sp. HH130630-07]ANY09327.1 hypothetical protein AFB00_27245 [Pseudonocardia sp. HH130630-07]
MDDGPAPTALQPISDTAPELPGPPLLGQQWRDVSFLHWAVDPAVVAAHLPAGVRPDLFEGRAYVGLVPFRMVGTHLGRGPGLPWLGTFAETNVRLYTVDDAGHRAVVFRSLDAARALPVLAGRIGFGLPYVWTRMRHRVRPHGAGTEHVYTARRRWASHPVTSTVRVRVGDEPATGGLESFLTARWGLHVAHLGRTWFLPNHHEPWPLRRAEAVEVADGVLPAAGFGEVTGRAPDHVMHAAVVHTRFGRPQALPG